MKQVSLADMAVNAPTAQKPSRQRRAVPEKGVSKVPRDKDNTNRVQVAFRMDKDAYRELKRMALDEDTTVNELMVRAIDELRARKGLKKTSG
jgi:NRPS condensation-like uncharacterized protein